MKRKGYDCCTFPSRIGGVPTPANGLTKQREFTLCDELFNEQQKNCERELMLYSKFAN
jgi:hypothetical protein